MLLYTGVAGDPRSFWPHEHPLFLLFPLLQSPPVHLPDSIISVATSHCTVLP